MTRRDFDNYGTHPGIARWAVGHATRLCGKYHDGRILEPCCGDDAPFASAGKEAGLFPFGYDIRDVAPELWSGRDADYVYPDTSVNEFATQWWDGRLFDIIATNPPFRIGENVIRKSLELLSPFGSAVFLVKMAFLGTQERSKMYIERPPAEIHILTKRPSFSGDGKTDVAQEYCLVFWLGDELDRMWRRWNRPTMISWLDNKPLMTDAQAKPRTVVEKGEEDGTQ